jgi:hypothetical protein
LNYLLPIGTVLNLPISLLIGFHKSTSHLIFILRRTPSPFSIESATID